jgi:acyl-CoA synthetase (NDP forming)
MTQQSLEKLLRPSSIAVIGASDEPTKVSGRPIAYLKRYGYDGQIYPVNPRRDEVQGLKCYPSIGAVPGSVDVAIVAIPATAVIQTLNHCADAGVASCIIFSSGFSELGEEGGAVQREITNIARRSGMRVLGPNCQGVFSVGARATPTFASAFAQGELTAGPGAIVSQSGAVAAMLYQLLGNAGSGIQYYVATGNESDVTVADVMLDVVRDPEVSVVLGYLEDLKDPEGLARAGDVARQEDKPILVLKSGRTAEGKAAASSHTGALAGDDDAVEEFFHKHGIVRVGDLIELAAFSQMFGQRKRAVGRRVAVVTNSGGLGVMVVDQCKELGLEVAVLQPETIAGLEAMLPGFASAANPVDVTTQLLFDPRLLSRAVPLLMDDPGVDAVLASFGALGGGYDIDAIIGDLAQANDDHDALLAVGWVGAHEDTIRRLGQRGVPAAQNPSLTVRSLAAYVQFSLDRADAVRSGPSATTRGIAADVSTTNPGPASVPSAADVIAAYQPLTVDGFLSEYNSKRLLQELSVLQMSDVLLAPTSAGSSDLALPDFPVVAKASSPAIPHKSDHGLVVLGIPDHETLETVVKELTSRAEDIAPGTVEGVLVQEMVEGGFEAFVGVKRDATFGHVVVVGAGGIFIEIFSDYQCVLPPITYEYALAKVEALKAFPAMAGARGGEDADYEALARLVVEVGRAVEYLGDALLEMDLNPVKVLPKGQGVAVLDALVKLGEPLATPTP